MKTVSVQLDSSTKIDLEIFRSAKFESMTMYAKRVLVDIVYEHCDEVRSIRCSLSGARIGQYEKSEIESLIVQGIEALNMRRYNELMFNFTKKEFAQDIESLIDHVSIRCLLLARPAPSISGSRGRLAIETLSRQRQLMILVNQFLYDSGMFRDKFAGTEDMVSRLRKASILSDQIAADWSGDLSDGSEIEPNQFEDLYSGLVELDAKYLIAKLKFSRKEMEALTKHRESAKIDVPSLRAFVWSLIRWRDEHADLELTTNRWTQAAYREAAFNSYNSTQKVEHSNIMEQPKAAKKAAAAATRKPSKSTNVNKDMFSSLLSNMFGGVK